MPSEKSESMAMVERVYSASSDEELKSLYKDWAETYDATLMDGLKYLSPAKSALLLSNQLSEKDARILDVGTGTGVCGEALAELGFTNIDGLDYSPEMMAVATRRTHEEKSIYTKMIEADLNQPLDLPDAVYDALICTGTFTHSHVTASCLDELCRILKPGGVFACTIHKDVWQEAGFADAVDRLSAEGILNTISMEKDIYYETDTEPQGWFIVWEKSE